MSKIYITGDTHGFIDIDKIREFRDGEEGRSLTKNDYLIVAGDFGGVWIGNPKPGTELYNDLKAEGYLDYDKNVQEFWNKCPWTTLFIDGNHENFDALKEYPVSEWNGGKVQFITDSIIHLMRGQVFTINGKKIFTMGGARSTDQYRRTEHISWWKEEIPSKAEMQEAVNNLEKHNWKVDAVITHCCGTSLLPQVLWTGADSDPLTQFLDRLEFTFDLKYKVWYFGHYHVDIDIDHKFIALYDKVIELKLDEPEREHSFPDRDNAR